MSRSLSGWFQRQRRYPFSAWGNDYADAHAGPSAEGANHFQPGAPPQDPTMKETQSSEGAIHVLGSPRGGPDYESRLQRF
jgi:hypothetical protein